MAPDISEMSEMTMPSRQRIRNSNHGCLRSSTLPLCHGSTPNTEFYEWMVCFFQNAKTGKRAPNSSVKSSGANLYHVVHEDDLKWMESKTKYCYHKNSYMWEINLFSEMFN